ncbi:MAG: hypothetical protein AVDCRST_MAG64-2193, partial [uncultured Phycisphaerae bacterium]
EKCKTCNEKRKTEDRARTPSSIFHFALHVLHFSFALRPRRNL